MTVHVVELASVVPQPWRNGGGVTRELLAWPPGSGDDWQVRVSVADIERDGPFSAYPGVQRCFAVLEGAGVELTFPSGEQRLTRGSGAIAFEGALAPGCRLLDGLTRDLNLMVRGNPGCATMHRASAVEPVPAGCRWRGLFTASPLRLDTGTGAPQALPALSLAWGDAPASPWRLSPAAGSPLRAWILAWQTPS